MTELDPQHKKPLNTGAPNPRQRTLAVFILLPQPHQSL